MQANMLNNVHDRMTSHNWDIIVSKVTKIMGSWETKRAEDRRFRRGPNYIEESPITF